MGNPLSFLQRPVACWLSGLAVFLAALGIGLPAIAQADPAMPSVSARLVMASAEPAAGSTIPVALEVDPGQGWHIYWENPGDSGYAPKVDWTLPQGFALAPLVHPAPERIVVGGIAMNVHLGRTMLVSRLSVPAGLPMGKQVVLRGEGDFLVCSQDLCVPRTVSIERTVVIGSGARDPSAAARIEQAASRVPQDLTGDVHFKLEKDVIAIPLPPAIELGRKGRLQIFSARSGDGTLGALQRIGKTPDGKVEAIFARGSLSGRPDHQFVAVLNRSGAPAKAWKFHGVLAPTTGQQSSSGPSHGYMLVLGAVGGAVLGGLFLNLMPCVFPILSLKALSLLRAGGSEREARVEAVGYLLGAVGVMVALGAAVLAMRAGGQAVGWAFQLQDPRVVALLLLVVTAIAANLAGLFEIPALSGSGLSRTGFFGATGTGALAAFVATPCTGPFMAGALGTALLLPSMAAMGVFAGLGLGLALPFLIVAFWAPARRWLPRPGAWMVTVRKVLSLPMFATALALAWLLGKQAGVDAMTRAMAAAMLLGAGLWWWGARQRGGRHAWPVLVVAAGAFALGGAVPYRVGAALQKPIASEDGQPVAYSAQRLEALRKEHRPVLLYATASWCLTCKVNEASSLTPGRVRKAFKTAGAVMMEADWTRNDPAVTRLLAKHGRAGVPLYLFYPPTGSPTILPQILTPGMVIGLLGADAQRREN